MSQRGGGVLGIAEGDARWGPDSRCLDKAKALKEAMATL